jgi:hypothetical protein
MMIIQPLQVAFFVYNSAFQCCLPNPLTPRGAGEISTPEKESFACKINRALASGPISITKNATIADWSH